jgi:secreted trypsin-like serine protease
MYQNYETHPVNLLFDALDTKDTTVCGGDSGGPWVYLDGQTIVYLGATSTVNGYNPCQAKYLDSTNNYAEITTVVNFSSVIQEAQDYVNLHPLPTASPSPTPTPLQESKTSSIKSMTIICVAGKKSVKVTAINPKCLKGYKAKK